jgi:uncharacterized protein YgiM (DUF1202 family)
MAANRKNHSIRYLPWVICVLTIAALPAVSIADYIRIKGSVVNVRQGPGTSHQVLFQAEQGEEFDLVSTEGLWCLVKLPTGQDAWVFRKLVEVVEGQRAGSTLGEEEGKEAETVSSKWSWITQIGLLITAFLLAAVGIWKRKEIIRYTGVKLRDISGYKRDQAFRYDNRKPSDDSWEL